MSRIVLQHVVFPVGIVMPAAKDAMLPLYLHTEDSSGYAVKDRNSVQIRPDGLLSLDSYFNRLHAGYWARFTDLETVILRLDVRGKGHLAVQRSAPGGRVLHVHSQDLDGDGVTEVELPLASLAAGGTLWFDVFAGDDGITINSATWEAEAQPVREVVPDIVICTYERPADVVGCLAGLAGSDELRQGCAHVWVIDNGTKSFLEAEGGQQVAQTWGEKLRVIRQNNLGGSGGFSRGMYEALEAGRATHVFLLDDDVVVEPEGLRRALVMASLTSSPTLVGAHMLERLRPTTLWTTGEVLDPVNFSIMAADPVDGYRLNLEHYRQESVVTCAFNGWWSCLIPAETIRAIGLSLPFFIKWDDIEFGYRAAEAGYPTISLPGAAVWHESWDTKDDVDNWTLYFTVRNRLIHASMESARLTDVEKRKRARSVIRNILRNDLLVFLTRRMYANASAVVAAFDDFANGTSVLEATSLTEQAVRVRSARKGFVDVPVPFPTNRLEALDGFEEPKHRKQIATMPLSLGAELLAGEPSERWRLKRDLRTALDIGARENVGLEVLPKANDRWWSILKREDVYVSTIDGKAMSRRRRNSAQTRRLLREGTAAARRAQKAVVDDSAEWAAKRETLSAVQWWETAFDNARVGVEGDQ